MRLLFCLHALRGMITPLTSGLPPPSYAHGRGAAASSRLRPSPHLGQGVYRVIPPTCYFFRSFKRSLYSSTFRAARKRGSPEPPVASLCSMTLLALATS